MKKMGRGSAPCRVCMKKSKDTVELQAIFVRTPRITYLESYNTCTQLNALIDDGLPRQLCTICKDELKAAFQFVEKAKESDKKLREKLGGHRITRSSHRIKQEEHSTKNQLQPPTDVETIFEEIKTEFINCSKDPLEDSDVDSVGKSEDEIEMNWLSDGENIATNMEIDGFADGNLVDDDDEDDKPLKELLIKKEKFKPAKVEEPFKESTVIDSSDIFNDFPEPDNFSSDDDDVFNNEMTEHVPDPPITAEAQIFPQGRFMCKICKKTYFTAAGLKAHIAVHMPKNAKAKRVRGPNKKKGKNKKKSGTGDEDDEEGGDDHKDEDDSELKKNDNTVTSEGKDETTKDEATKPEDTSEADIKKKRRGKTPKPKKMFPCHVCGKHMISASKLRYHMVMHTGEKDYLCTMCPKAYSTIYALKHHMRTHTGERPYECKFCGDKFTRPTTLKSHMRRHTGERPYGCDICGKRFIQHSSMTTHMKLNHMAKTIACPHCDKKYARQTDLNTHLLSHTGDKPFSCSHCPSRFIRQANLNKHMNQHHSQKAHAAAAAAAVAAAATAVATDQMLRQQTMQIQQQQQNQINPPIPRVVDVRSLSKQGSSAVPTGGVITATPTNVGSDESNSSQMLPPPPPPHQSQPPQVPPPQSVSQQQQQQQQQQHHQQQQQQQSHMQQPNIGQSHPANNVSIPMSMNIAGIPGGIPSHNILGPIQTAGSLGGGAAGAGHIPTHGRLESVEHLKGIHHPVENITNLIGQVIDSDRMGRSVDDLMRWNWPNGS